MITGQTNLFNYINEFDTPKAVDIKGICDDGYCPRCNVALDDLISVCPWCKQRLDWNEWKRINQYGKNE